MHRHACAFLARAAALAGLGLVTAAPLAAQTATDIGAGSERGLIVTEPLERAAFRSADSNGDGVIDEAELAADAIAAFVTLDADGDGVLSLAELAGVSAAAFAQIDVDRSGGIDLTELRLAKLAAFNAADSNLNGVITLAELLKRERGGR